ncbi:hypothetical protein BO99DRAFT_438684 [Aspergillus violaceofuscus CBS 115571]|uniref:Protein kinase domain-containing protein n=1 Tax=Aspergillus violaceofuscus (strain CBS 115571) TaxID=1450538 RepID=A0A2V5GPK0_ASPV1|nr:hypothetical protein BO99DRAFT_438684 [Aspergillus violaceofuscus CBS 115571]
MESPGTPTHRRMPSIPWRWACPPTSWMTPKSSSRITERPFLWHGDPRRLFTPPALYSPPEDLFNEPILQPTAADIWTLGVNLYEVLGERPLFETFAWDRDDIVAEMVNPLGAPAPTMVEFVGATRAEFFEADELGVPGPWRDGADVPMGRCSWGPPCAGGLAPSDDGVRTVRTAHRGPNS